MDQCAVGILAAEFWSLFSALRGLWGCLMVSVSPIGGMFTWVVLVDWMCLFLVVPVSSVLELLSLDTALDPNSSLHILSSEKSLWVFAMFSDELIFSGPVGFNFKADSCSPLHGMNDRGVLFWLTCMGWPDLWRLVLWKDVEVWDTVGTEFALVDGFWVYLFMADATYWLEVRLEVLRKERSFLRSGTTETTGLLLAGWMCLVAAILFSTSTFVVNSFNGSLASAFTILLGWNVSAGLIRELFTTVFVVFRSHSETAGGGLFRPSVVSLAFSMRPLLWSTAPSCLSLQLQKALAFPWSRDPSLSSISDEFNEPPTLLWLIPSFTMFPWSSILMASTLNVAAGTCVKACETAGLGGTTVNVFVPKRDVTLRVILPCKLALVLETPISSCLSVAFVLWVVEEITGFFPWKDWVFISRGAGLISVLTLIFCTSTFNFAAEDVFCLSVFASLFDSLIFLWTMFSSFLTIWGLFSSDSPDWLVLDSCGTFALLFLWLSAAVRALLFLFRGSILDWWEIFGPAAGKRKLKSI